MLLVKFGTTCLSMAVLIFVIVLHIEVGVLFYKNVPDKFILKVEKGDSARSIAKRLKQHNAIISSTVFIHGATYYGLDKILKPGEYILTNNLSIKDILNKIANGDSIKYYVNVKECITSWELNKLFEELNFLENDVKNLGLTEGSYAPDTYLVSFKTKASDLLDIMKRRQIEILDKEWENKGKRFPRSLKKADALILASIIEEEAANIREMPIISSVFTNRLEKGMRLQSDPTVSYGIDLGNTSIRKKLTKKDLKLNSDYNTYRRTGMPPSPICNPSQAAIHSALNPADTDYLFFVLNSSGSHTFSQDFNQHKREVLKLRAIRQD